MSYQSISRWKRDYLAGGFEALVPSPRQASPRTPGEVLELAAALKRENPERTAAQVQRILGHAVGLGALGPDAAAAVHPAGAEPAARGPGVAGGVGRFEATRPNELWTGDALHGPSVGGRKTYLFCFIAITPGR